MGEVYRAKDPRLEREVALKILTPAASDDAEQQKLFLNEARAASALNHPNILVVYDVGTEQGVQYLVSELVDGEPIRKEISSGPVRLRRLFDLAAQIADGLAAAHDAGIAHRDLKPENIMVTREGRVKIVDFGLAKTAWRPTADSDPTRSWTGTETGRILGTVPYMSPELAKGERVDFRSDQFSLGLVLYELATGTHAFRRATAIQTLSAIISEEPEPVSNSNTQLPAPLRWMIERCLAKEPSQRYVATADLYRDLATLRDHFSEALSSGDHQLPSVGHTTRTRVFAALALLAVVGVGVVALLTLLFFSSDVRDPASYQFTPFAADSSYQGSAAWSPDGKTIAYVAEADGIVQVFTRSLGSSLRAQTTRSRFDCHDPFWSPDGTRVFYISLAREKDGLYSVSPAGGPSDLVMENVRSAAISPDGRTLALFREESAGNLPETLWLSAPPGDEPRRYMRPPFGTASFSDTVVHFSPDGSKMGIWAAGGRSTRAFWVIPLPDGNPYVVNPLSNLPPNWPSFSWLPDSRHIVTTIIQPPTPGTHLWLVDTQGSTARPVTLGVASENFPAVSPDGSRIAFNAEEADFDLMEVPLDGSPAKTLLGTSRNEMDPAWSPTSAEYAFVTDRTGNQQIWLRSQEGRFERPIVTETGFEDDRTYLLSGLTFSPDGQRIAYARQGGRNRIWISTLAGGPPVRLTRNQDFEDAPTWSPDGNWIAFTQQVSTRSALAKARAGGGEPPIEIKGDITALTRPQWSPDGRWIACETPEGLSLVSPDGRDVRLLTEVTWLVYGWAGDGTHLYGIRQRDDARRLMLASIDIQTGKQRIVNADLGPIPLANLPVRGFTRISARSVATSIVRVRADVWLLEGFGRHTGFLERFWPKRATLHP